MSTGGAFEFGDGYIYSVYVSTVQKDTLLSVDVRFSDACIHCGSYYLFMYM